MSIRAQYDRLCDHSPPTGVQCQEPSLGVACQQCGRDICFRHSFRLRVNPPAPAVESDGPSVEADLCPNCSKEPRYRYGHAFAAFAAAASSADAAGIEATKSFASELTASELTGKEFDLADEFGMPLGRPLVPPRQAASEQPAESALDAMVRRMTTDPPDEEAAP